MDIKNMTAIESIGTCSEIKVQYESRWSLKDHWGAKIGDDVK